MDTKTTYKPQIIYIVLALISLVIAAVFIWDLLGGIELGGLLYLGVSTGTLLWSGNKSLISVTTNESQFVVHRPLVDDIAVEYGQLISVSDEGRLMSTLVINYHPREDTGLLDLDSARSIILPAVREQAQLLSTLQEKTPA